MNNEENLYISPKGVLQLIFGTVLFPDLQEIKAYYTCKNKLDKIVELLALRKYGKSKKEIFKEIQNIKDHTEMYKYIDNIYEKYIFYEDIYSTLNS